MLHIFVKISLNYSIEVDFVYCKIVVKNILCLIV